MRAEPRGGGPRPHRSGILGIPPALWQARACDAHAERTDLRNRARVVHLQNNHEQYERGLLWLKLLAVMLAAIAFVSGRFAP